MTFPIPDNVPMREIEELNDKSLNLSKKYDSLYQSLIEMINEYIKDRNLNDKERRTKFIEYVLANHGYFLQHKMTDSNFIEKVVGNICFSTTNPTISTHVQNIIRNNLEHAVENTAYRITNLESVKKEELKLLIQSVGLQSMRDINKLVSSAFEVFVERVDKEIHGLAEEGLVKAKSIDKEFEDRINKRSIEHQIRVNKKKIESTKNEQKKQFLDDINRINEKRLKLIDNDPKGFMGGFKKIGIINDVLLKLNAAHSFVVTKSFNFGIALRRYEHNKRIYQRQGGRLRRNLFITGKHFAIISVGIYSALSFSIKTVSFIKKGITRIAKTVLPAIQTCLDMVSLGLRSTARILTGAFSLAVNSITTAGNVVLSAPFKIMGWIRNFLSKPIVVKFVDFLRSDAGAMMMGTLWAFYDVYVKDFITDTKEEIGNYIHGNGKLKKRETVIKNRIKQEYESRFVEFRFKDFSKALFYGKNIEELISYYREKGSHYSEIGSKGQEYEDHYFMKRFVFTVMMKSMEVRNFLDQAFCREERKTDDAIKQYEGDMTKTKKIRDYIAYSKDGGIFKIKQFLGWKRDNNVSMEFLISTESQHMLKRMSRFFDGFTTNLEDIAIEMVGGTIGAVVGNLIFPGFGGILGGFVGGALGSLINKYRNDAKDKKKAYEILSNVKKQERMLQRERDMNELDDLMVLRSRNGVFRRKRTIDDLEKKIQELKGGGKGDDDAEIAGMKRDISRVRGEIASDEKGRQELDLLEFKISEYRMRGTLTRKEEQQLKNLRNAAAQDSGNFFGVKIERDSNGNISHIGSMSFAVFSDIFEGDEDRSKKFTTKATNEQWLNLRHTLANNILKLIEQYSSNGGENVTFQDILDYRNSAFEEMAKIGKTGHNTVDRVKKTISKKMKSFKFFESVGYDDYIISRKDGNNISKNVNLLKQGITVKKYTDDATPHLGIIEKINSEKMKDEFNHVENFLEDIKKSSNGKFLTLNGGKVTYVGFRDKDGRQKFLKISKFEKTESGLKLDVIETEIVDYSHMDETILHMFNIEMERRDYNMFEKELLSINVQNGVTLEQFIQQSLGVDDVKGNPTVSATMQLLFDEWRYAGKSFFKENGVVILYRFMESMNKAGYSESAKSIRDKVLSNVHTMLQTGQGKSISVGYFEGLDAKLVEDMKQRDEADRKRQLRISDASARNQKDAIEQALKNGIDVRGMMNKYYLQYIGYTESTDDAVTEEGKQKRDED